MINYTYYITRLSHTLNSHIMSRFYYIIFTGKKFQLLQLQKCNRKQSSKFRCIPQHSYTYSFLFTAIKEIKTLLVSQECMVTSLDTRKSKLSMYNTRSITLDAKTALMFMKFKFIFLLISVSSSSSLWVFETKKSAQKVSAM